jgi:uncharacterized RDD family membrane protein YckC
VRWWDGVRWTEHVSAPPPATSYAVGGPQVSTRLGTVVLSGWWRRFGAYVLDSIIVAVPALAIGAIVGSIALATPTAVTGQRTVSDGAQVALILTAVVLALAYPFLFLRYRGQTPGMMAFRIRAIDRVGGGPLTTAQTWRRVLALFFLVTIWAEIAAIIDFNTVGSSTPGSVTLRLITFAGLVATALWPLGNPCNQTLQDKAADTIVVLTG